MLKTFLQLSITLWIEWIQKSSSDDQVRFFLSVLVSHMLFFDDHAIPPTGQNVPASELYYFVPFPKHSFPLSCFLISLGLLVRCHPPREPCRALLCSIIPLFLWPSLIFLQRIYHYLGLYLFVYLFIFLSRVKFYKGSFVLFTTVWLILAHHHYYNC